jgi:hypothetical protein
MTRNSLFAIEALNAYKNQLHPSPVEIGKKGGKNATKMRSTSGVLNYFDEESMRFGAIFLLFAASIASGQVSTVNRSPNLRHWATGAGSEGVLFPLDSKKGAQPEARHCAHIVISEVPGTDPKIMKSTPKFSSNMAMLQVPPPCYQDSARNHDWGRLSCDSENRCR